MAELDINRVVLELKKGDENALDELFQFYYPKLFSFARTFIKNSPAIDDVLQEVFIRIWNNRASINSASTFNALIYTITKNLLLNELRAMVSDEKMRGELKFQAVATEFATQQKVEFNEVKTQVEKVIAELPEKQEQIFRMSREEGLSYKEIAEKLQISVKTVEYHMSQALKVIKSRLKELGLYAMLYCYLFL